MEEQKLLKRRRKALKDGNEELLVSVCTDLANLYSDEGRYESAIKEYKVVANIYKKQNKMLEYATANRGIGEAYLGLHNFTEALKYQKIYLDIAKELKNKLEEQRALATIGHTYLSSYLELPESDKSKLELANKFFKKSLVVSQSLIGIASKLEVADMSARLFSNLGLVQDCMGNFNAAKELINKSINLCRAHDLYEQLQRGYLSLASLLVKTEDYKSALQQYNLAAEAAKKLRNKPSILAGILLSKSEILLKLGDFQGAKHALFKAYKLKLPDMAEHKTIENNLRIAAFMCCTEDKLLMTADTAYNDLKKLYEKMGDAACELKLFDKALDYYKKMLNYAEKAELSNSEIASCYYSLAETYKDNGQFDEAVVYFEKELELCRCLKDSLNTLSKIADTKEAADGDIATVRTIYKRAIELCQNENNTHEEGRMLKRFILYLKRQKQHSEAFKLEENLSKLDFHSSDSESESSESQCQSVIGGDIDLETITDVSGDSDIEQSSAKTRRRNFKIKRNEKGETQLHTACIKGQLNVVRHLLEQGHPINVRDNCGWLPLHEACINGHLDVVEVLLEKGAAINDRGGPHCEGITPLHDAASNGHLPIVELLLNKGANAVAKTDEGKTVLDFLKIWRSSEQLNEDSQKLYENLVEQISQALEKAGHSVESFVKITPTKSMRRSALVGLEDDEDESPQRSQRICKNPTPDKDLRRSNSFGLEDYSRSHTSDYKDVMENLRRRKEILTIRESTKQSALLSSEDVIDDWLEDDLEKMTKKRKTNSPAKSQSNEDVNFENFMIIDNDLSTPKKKSPLKFVRKKQTKLTNFGHTRSLVEADSTSSPIANKPSPKKFPRSSSFELPVLEPTFHVDVRIDKKLFRVPVSQSEVRSNTIKWLADEAAARYAKKEYMVPTLELETKNGALLADDDPISLLFSVGANQAEEVEGRIIKWNVPSLSERYKEACQDMSVETNDKIDRILQEFSVILDLSNCGFKGAQLAPLCKVLNRQINLIELDLSGNFLTNECFQFLANSLPTLENLYKLSLSCTCLKSEHLQILINLSNDGICKVTDLDLSDNLLGDESLENLALISRKFQLKKFNLSGNKFTKDVFQTLANKNITLNLEQVEEFDISDNSLGNAALIRILSWLNCHNLESINVSRNGINAGFVKEMMNIWSEGEKLKICKLSRCCVTDSDIFDLLRIAPSLQTLDASYNNDLTSISLRKLLQTDIQNLILYGCKNILQYFTEFSRYVDTSSPVQQRSLKISLPENCFLETQYLINMWKELYGSKTIVEQTSHLLSISSE